MKTTQSENRMDGSFCSRADRRDAGEVKSSAVHPAQNSLYKYPGGVSSAVVLLVRYKAVRL